MTSSRKPPAKHADDVPSASERREELVKRREEILKGIDEGRITRRDVFKMGLLTTSGMLVAGSGLGLFSKGAQAQVVPPPIPTGTPPSPAFGAQPFTQAMPRLIVQEPQELTPASDPTGVGGGTELEWPAELDEPNIKQQSWHTDFTLAGGAANPADPGNEFRNPRTGRGPMEGRAPGVFFAHQRWEEYLPKVGYLMTIGRIKGGYRFHKNMPKQQGNSIWCFGAGGLYKENGKLNRGVLAPPLIKVRYGEPALVRIYNALPKNRAKNNGFGRNEFTTHNHNAHNASASDGASNCHIFPGQFYDYHWGTTLARADMINSDKSEPRASGPDGEGGLTHVKGDFRELQSTLWFHDHRFFFTAENVYKGEFGMLNYYSGPDRGNENEMPNDGGVNHRLPSGTTHDWGNVDFDVNIAISDAATDQNGQYFFDIFNTDGFLGDLMMVNMKYKPFFKVLPRRYRFRLLCACMSRFIKLVLVDENDNKVPFKLIANDGNFLNHPFELDELDQQGVAERFDIVVDFKGMKGKNLRLVNVLEHEDGRGPEKELSVAEALSGTSPDPAVGALLQFRVRNKVKSADQPGVTLLAAAHSGANDTSNPCDENYALTEQIPIVTPVRTREIQWVRGGNDNGVCIPECGDKEDFPWKIKVNGEEAHFLNANRVSNLIPKPGEVEHWTLKNGGGGWDHPIHLHTEEGVTIDRGGDPIPPWEQGARKDVWRLREGASVTFQVRFGEYGGAYVNHCHNTVHEDNAMLLRFDTLTDPTQGDAEGRPSTLHTQVIPTPNPTPDGVVYLIPEILPEGDPTNSEFFEVADNSGTKKAGPGGNGESSAG